MGRLTAPTERRVSLTGRPWCRAMAEHVRRGVDREHGRSGGQESGEPGQGRGGAAGTQGIVLAGGDQDGRAQAQAEADLGGVEEDLDGWLAGDDVADDDGASGDHYGGDRRWPPATWPP